MAILNPPNWKPGSVRIRARGIDPLDGLRGHAYIAARNLNKAVTRPDADPSIHQSAVINIIRAEQRRHLVRQIDQAIRESVAVICIDFSKSTVERDRFQADSKEAIGLFNAKAAAAALIERVKRPSRPLQP